MKLYLSLISCFSVLLSCAPDSDLTPITTTNNDTQTQVQSFEKVAAQFEYEIIKETSSLNLSAQLSEDQMRIWKCTWLIKDENSQLIYSSQSCQASYELKQAGSYYVSLEIAHYDESDPSSITKNIIVSQDDLTALELEPPKDEDVLAKISDVKVFIANDCALACHGVNPIGANGFSMGNQSEAEIYAGLVLYLEDNLNDQENRLKQKPTDSYLIMHGGGERFAENSEKSKKWNTLIDRIIEIEINQEVEISIDPIAKFSYEINGLTVKLDASESIKGSNNTHTYSWKINNLLVPDGEMSSYTFLQAGDYEVTLLLEDSESKKQSTLTQTIMLFETVTQTSCTDSNLILCDDFENGIDSKIKGSAAIIDENVGYKSRQSLKVVGEAGFMSVDAPESNNYWTRVFVKSESSSAEYQQGFAKGHGTYLKSTYQTDLTNYELRVGDHRCQLELNRDDNIQNNAHSQNNGTDHVNGNTLYMGDDLEMTSGAYGDDSICENSQSHGARMHPEKWYCLEVHFNGRDSEFQVFWDNQNVQSLHVSKDRTWTNSDKKPFSVTLNNDPNTNPNSAYSYHADKQWGPYFFDEIQFGYTNYSESVNKTTWFDDFAVAEERIGCGVDYVVNEVLDSSTWLDEQDNCYPYSGDASCPDGLIGPKPIEIDPRGHEGVLFGNKTQIQRYAENTALINSQGSTRVEAEDFVNQSYGNEDYRGARWFMVQTKEQEVSTLPEFEERCEMATQELIELENSNIKYGNKTLKEIIANMWGNNQTNTFWDPISEGTGRESGANVGVTKMIEQWKCNPVIRDSNNGFNYEQTMNQASGNSVVSLLPDILYNNHNEAPHAASNWSGSGAAAPKVYYKLDLPKAGNYEVVIRTYRHGTDSGSGHWGHTDSIGSNENMSTDRGINISGSGWKNWTVEFTSNKSGEYYFILAGREDGFMYDYFEITPK